jgi:hypothetical protein
MRRASRARTEKIKGLAMGTMSEMCAAPTWDCRIP